MPYPKKYNTPEEKAEAVRIQKRNRYRLKHGIPLDKEVNHYSTPEEKKEAQKQLQIKYKEAHKEQLKQYQKEYYQKKRALKNSPP